MNEGNYILVNGSFVPMAEYRISLRESDGFLFSERIRAVRSAFPFFRETLEMIKQKLMIFNQTFPELTENDGAELKRQMERTLTKNKHFLGAVLSLRFRISEQKIQYSIQSAKNENIGYVLNDKGLYVAVFDTIRKSVSSLSNTSLGSEINWRIAENYPKDVASDEFLLLNTDDQIIEAVGSNIYLIKGSRIKGTSIYHGAYADISKPLMLNLFNKLQLNYSEKDGITDQDMKDADEIFLVSAIDGIRWVVGFEGKRYFNNTIRKINDLFVRSLLS
ncbi:MAG: aminotransferase class IV [Prolixibacteraceae bacterium]|nr:aminotransferase class IV [Prolixibacteraceae bacterium]